MHYQTKNYGLKFILLDCMGTFLGIFPGQFDGTLEMSKTKMFYYFSSIVMEKNQIS